MAEYIERDEALMEIENEYKNVEKIKTPFALIVVGGSTEKPCYSIAWWDTTSKDVNIGYSSYFLAYVRKWLEVVFEVTEDADVVDVETVKAWMYAIAMNNVGVKADDVASVCEDIAERMDGLRAFARERRGEDG